MQLLIHSAIGDAYGAGFEFANHSVIEQHNKLAYYIPHPKFTTLKGRYTDDTQMSLALAELILSGQEWTPLTIANAFVDTFKRDPRLGYARRFHAFLTEIPSGEAFLKQIINTSERNGAAMRAPVLGIFPDEATVIERSSIQAAVTHNQPAPILAANAIALASHFLMYKKGAPQELISYLNDWQKADWKAQWTEEVSMYALDAVEAVLTILRQGGSMSTRLKASIALGGDVDTVGALVLALSSLEEGVEQDLPAFLLEDLEDGVFGKTYLQEVDVSLTDLLGN